MHPSPASPSPAGSSPATSAFRQPKKKNAPLPETCPLKIKKNNRNLFACTSRAHYVNPFRLQRRPSLPQFAIRPILLTTMTLSGGAFVAPCVLPHRTAAPRSRGRPRPGGARCAVDFSPVHRPPDGSLASRLLRLTRPRPVTLARRDLDQKFAVLLMRTSYDVLDGLDIVAMDRFQRAFFERRQTEWSYYLADNANAVRQGLLTDVRCV